MTQEGELVITAVHPWADQFPLLPRDETEQLAESLASSGQAEPVTVTPDGVLLDGRNRILAATQPLRARVFTGTDEQAVTLIVALNVERRNLTKRQQSIVAARVSKLEMSDQLQGSVARVFGVSDAYLSEALTILRHDLDLADRVLAGTVPFDAALRTAKRSQRRSEPEPEGERLGFSGLVDLRERRRQKQEPPKPEASQRRKPTSASSSLEAKVWSDYLEMVESHLLDLACRDVSAMRVEDRRLLQLPVASVSLASERLSELLGEHGA